MDLFIGLMSGTSLDGVDAVLVGFPESRMEVLANAYLPYPEAVRKQLLVLGDAGSDELHLSALLSQVLSLLYAQAVAEVMRKAGVTSPDVRAVGCHGQPVRHRPDQGYTLQLGNPALLAEKTGITVVADFRSRDIAAGGQGAPLVPAFHKVVFGDPQTHRIILNLGGIANVTNLYPSSAVTGFDCGPANILLDAWIEADQGKSYDSEGAWGKSGTVVPGLLDELMAHPYFQMSPPKSCGREQFNLGWVRKHLRGHERSNDVQATLLNLTGRSIAMAIDRWCGRPAELYVCGGGAKNSALMELLGSTLPSVSILKTDALGVPAELVEATAFAWLARQTLHGCAGNLPEVTGAQGYRVLGAIYPA